MVSSMATKKSVIRGAMLVFVVINVIIIVLFAVERTKEWRLKQDWPNVDTEIEFTP